MPKHRPVRATRARARCARRPSLHVLALALTLAALPAASAFADIYKHVDAEGRVTYSNLPMPGAVRIDASPQGGEPKGSGSTGRNGASRSAGAAASPSPASFPKVDSATQKGRDDVRRKILLEELATEEKLLSEAASAYGGGRPPPLPGEAANSPKYLERVAKLKQSVDVHERNIAALKQELERTK